MVRKATPKKASRKTLVAKKDSTAKKASTKRKIDNETATRTSAKSETLKKRAVKKTAASKGAAKPAPPMEQVATTRIPGTVARVVTETDGTKTVYVWDHHGQPIRQDLYHS